MKTVYTLISAFVLLAALPFKGISQSEWPKTVTTSDGDLIKVYEWQPEFMENGSLKANAAISVMASGKSDPVFGMIWLNAEARNEQNEVFISGIKVTDIKLPDEDNGGRTDYLQNALQSGMNRWNLVLPQSALSGSLNQNAQQQKLADSYNNNPPKIIYAARPSLLVLIDGAPKIQKNSKWNLESVVNTPFNIFKTGSSFFLYGGKHWYQAKTATGPYAITTNVPAQLSAIEAEIIQQNKENNVQQEEKDYVISNIIVSTEPAELLQSNGEPEFVPVQQTSLLYVKNSDNDIFMDVNGQLYYVLLSGRWYRSSSLSGKWQYIGADRLPADFAKIPEGSPKDNVLASVAGTLAAKDAVQNAQVPQTAKVDRNNATANVEYDGNPQFEDIDGTDMAYAVNTSGQVLRWRNAFYVVDNGVWFTSRSAMGPWVVSVNRPINVALIPPQYPVYGMKYVNIYDVTPDYVYMGYTPGYLNAYVYGPTVVYGTGYHYNPWFRQRYFARPFTWGFNMNYNPWTGWGFGFNYNVGWFNTGWYGSYYGWNCGWWGPRIYTPSYWSPYYGGYRHGYYGYYGRNHGNTVIINNVNVYRNNNIYHNRSGVVMTRDNRNLAYNRNNQSAPVRRFANSPAPGRSLSDNSGRATANRNAGDGFSPRASNRNGGVSSSNRPSRSFNESNNNNNGNTSGRRIAEGANESGSVNRGPNRSNGNNVNGNNGVRRSFEGAPVQRQNTESGQPSRNVSPRSSGNSQPVQRQSNQSGVSGRSNSPAVRQQQSQRSVQPSSGSQRSERSAPARSSRATSESRGGRG